MSSRLNGTLVVSYNNDFVNKLLFILCYSSKLERLLNFFLHFLSRILSYHYLPSVADIDTRSLGNG